MKLFNILLLVLFIIPINSCMDRNFEDLKNIPIIQKEETYRVIQRQDLGYHFKHKRGHNSVRIEVPNDVKFLLLDKRYKVVDYYYFLRFNNWFKKIIFENGIMPINQNETLDCDNFAMLYKSLFSVGAYASDSVMEFAVASVVVEQKNPFGGIPSGGLHMLNLIFTSKEWYIFEPQTGEYTELQNYPNQEYIQFIML